MSEYSLKWVNDNNEKVLEQRRILRKAKREEFAAYHKEYRKNNKDKLYLLNKNYREANKEKRYLNGVKIS